jgi:ankyrin repeat protein
MCEGLVPLQVAVREGHAGVVRVLLQGGADPNPDFASADGYSLLHEAAERGHLDVVEVLISAGALPRVARLCHTSAGHVVNRECDAFYLIRPRNVTLFKRYKPNKSNRRFNYVDFTELMTRQTN